LLAIVFSKNILCGFQIKNSLCLEDVTDLSFFSIIFSAQLKKNDDNSGNTISVRIICEQIVTRETRESTFRALNESRYTSWDSERRSRLPGIT